MSPRRRDRGGDERAEARERSRARRREEYLDESAHSVSYCPGCRSSLPVLDGFNDLPEECPDCGARIRCGNCGSNLIEAERESAPGEPEVPLERGICPRCRDPVTGEETGPASEEFTWDSQ